MAIGLIILTLFLNWADGVVIVPAGGGTTISVKPAPSSTWSVSQNSLSAADTVTVSVYPSALSTVTVSANVTTASVQIIGSTSGRKALYVYNNSANSGYCVLGSGAANSSSNLSFIVATFTSFVQNAPVVWTGPISCIRNSGTGAFVTTELK